MKSFEALEEIAKLEQRNSLKRGKFLTLFHTPAVKSLDKNERREFFNYLRAKKAKNIFLIIIALVSFICIFVFRSGLTGGAVAEIGKEIGGISWVFATVFLVSLLLLIYEWAEDFALQKRFKRHIKIAEKAIR